MFISNIGSAAHRAPGTSRSYTLSARYFSSSVISSMCIGSNSDDLRNHMTTQLRLHGVEIFTHSEVALFIGSGVSYRLSC